METGVIRVLPSRWQGSVLVCGKCSKKLDGGFGEKGRTPLVKLLRRALGLKKGRKADRGVVEVKCLGVCPKNAVVMVDGARPDRWMLVPARAETDEIVAILTEPGAARALLPRQGEVAPKVTEGKDTEQGFSLTSPSVWQEPATSPPTGED